MANQIQNLMYEGYLADEPEMRYTPTGKTVTNFRMGSNRQWKDSEGKPQTETTWLKITAWGKLAEIVNQLCGKGSHVIVTGQLRPGANGSPDVYDLKNGGHGASYEITAREIRVLKGKENTTAQEADGSIEDTADIPF